jgi:hypothetical protein
MTINQHAHIYSFHTSNFIFGQIIFLKILSMQPLFLWRVNRLTAMVPYITEPLFF